MRSEFSTSGSLKACRPTIAPFHDPQRYRVGKAFQIMLSEIGHSKTATDKCLCRAIDRHAAGRCNTLNTRGQIDRRPEGRISSRQRGGARYDRTCCNPDADGDRWIMTAEPSIDPACNKIASFDRSGRVILMSRGNAEISEKPITQIFSDMPAECGDRIACCRLILGDQIPIVLGIHDIRQICRVRNI